jgi:peptidoglycan/xylan/chitin deacetylase (PgdA/CDA1 family)
MMEDAIATIKKHTGQDVAGWLAPALSHTPRIMDLLAQYGVKYTCDLFHDDQPLPVKVKKGRLISIPYSLEMNDTVVYHGHQTTPRRYGEIIKRNFDRLYEEGADSGTVMCIPLHAYQVGMPHRIAAFEEALAYITSHKDVWVTTGREIADYYYENYYDDVVRDIEAFNKGA